MQKSVRKYKIFVWNIFFKSIFTDKLSIKEMVYLKYQVSLTYWYLQDNILHDIPSFVKIIKCNRQYI